MPQRITVVDAFTDRVFAGNPAAVCILDSPATEPWMQNLAREMNLSETAFLRPIADRESSYSLRWFTPVAEVALCGHATLASAHVLWEEGRTSRDRPLRFETVHSGWLSATWDGGEITLDFPELPLIDAEAPEGLAAALGAEPVAVIGTGMDLLVELRDEEAIRSLRPDFGALGKIDVRGVIVTSRAATGDFDFISRFFAPAFGIDEDPVTGSAHCALAPYWGKRLGKAEMVGSQVSARGGVVRVLLTGGRVKLGGRAVTVWRGELVGAGTA